MSPISECWLISVSALASESTPLKPASLPLPTHSLGEYG